MIKAPFRFDVQYFSLIAVFRNIYYEEKYEFNDEKEKDIYVNKLKRSGDRYLTKKMIRDIQENGYYTIMSEKPTVYIFIQNNENNQIRGCANNNDNISLQIKFYFKDIHQMYSYIRNNCNSHNIKMTNKGSMIIDYIQGQNILMQIKIQSDPVTLNSQTFQDFWNEVKQAWSMRKQLSYKQRQEIYERPIKQGTISLFKKDPIDIRDKDQKNHNLQRMKASFKPKKVKQIGIVQSQQSSQDNFITQSSEKRKKDKYKIKSRPYYHDSNTSFLVESKRINKYMKYPVQNHESKKIGYYGQNGKKIIKSQRQSSQEQKQENSSFLKPSELQLINEIVKSKQAIISSLQSQSKNIKQSVDYNAEMQMKLLQKFDNKFNDVKSDQLLRLSNKINQISVKFIQNRSQYSPKGNKKGLPNQDNSNSQQILQNAIKPSKSQSQKQAESKNKDFCLQQYQKLNQNLAKINKKQKLQEKKLKKNKKRKQ